MGDYKITGGVDGTITGDLGTLFMDENISYVAGHGNIVGSEGGNGVKNMIIASTDAGGDINIGYDDPSDENVEQPIENLTIVEGAVFSPEAGQINIKEKFNNIGGLIGRSGLTLDGSHYGWTAAGRNPLTAAITWECWFKCSSGSGGDSFMSNDGVDGGGGARGSYLRFEASGQGFSWYVNGISNTRTTNSNIYVDGLPDSDDDKWHHLAGAIGGGFIYLYLDGRLIQKDAYTGTPVSDSGLAFTVGKHYQNSNLFTGQIARASVWNIALTEAQIRQMMFEDFAAATASSTPHANCVSWYQFDEGTGTEVANAVSGSNYLTLSTGTTWMINGDNSEYTYGTSTIKMTGATGIAQIPHDTGIYNLNCSPSGGNTDARNLAGDDFHVKGTFTANGGTFGANSTNRSRLLLWNTPVWGGTSMSTISFLPKGSGPLYLPYKNAEVAQTYGSMSVRCTDTRLSGDAICGGFDYTSSGVLKTQGYDFTLTSSSSRTDNGTLQVDGGSVLTMTHANGFTLSTGTLDIRGENAAAFSSKTAGRLSRAGSDTALEFGTNDFQFSFWWKNTRINRVFNADWNKILVKGNFFLYVKSDRVRIYFSGGNSIDMIWSGSDMVLDQWYHIVVTCKRDDVMKVYKNGVLMGTPVDISDHELESTAPSGSTQINQNDNTSGESWTGYLADFRVYNDEDILTQANVNNLYNSGLNPATAVNSDGSPVYPANPASGGNPTATTWWKLGTLTAASGARTTVPTIDLTDSSAGSLTLTNAGNVKPGFGLITKSSGAYEIAGICKFRNMKACSNSSGIFTITPLNGSVFKGKVVLD